MHKSHVEKIGHKTVLQAIHQSAVRSRILDENPDLRLDLPKKAAETPIFGDDPKDGHFFV